MNLTDEEIKSLIRKSQGWTELKEGPNQYGWERGDEWHYLHQVPNYPLDLNACAEFEATLTDEEYTTYSILLVNDTVSKRKLYAGGYSYSYKGSDCIPVYCMAMAVSATARQRCLAYLKTKGLIP